ncbi:MAG: PDDEXK nuclease domain-containing protein [Myxococcota bacterium]
MVNKPLFDDVLTLIDGAKRRAFQAVNAELVALYWQVGEYISKKIASAEWGDGVVEDLARAIARKHPGLRGFTRANLFRMRQFFESYEGEEIVAPLVRQLAWSHNLMILARCKSPEQRAFYVQLAAQERWTKRELERQIRSRLFERAVREPAKLSSALTQTHPEASMVFRDSYALEFLDLPDHHSEDDLHRGLLRNLGRFLTELGRDFCFVGSEYPIQVAEQDFAIDLLFFHRGLRCLVAIELKVRDFFPEDLGKLNFYLEALDRDVRKEHERPSIGMLLCATKNAKVVEYALSRSLSPALVAEYQTTLPDRAVLQAKLQELHAALTGRR